MNRAGRPIKRLAHGNKLLRRVSDFARVGSFAVMSRKWSSCAMFASSLTATSRNLAFLDCPRGRPSRAGWLSKLVVVPVNVFEYVEARRANDVAKNFVW